MNSDRISFVPGIPDKPIKSIINFDVEKITEPMVTDMFDRNLFYPIKSKTNSPKKKKGDEITCFLKFSIINTQTLQTRSYSDKNKKKIRVGRDESCEIVYDDITIRSEEFYFEAINDIWFLKKSENTNIGVYLSCESERNSNRMPVGEVYPEMLKVRKGL